MITFKKDHYFMIDEKQLDKQESIEFILFLMQEKNRHKVASAECLMKIKTSVNKSFIYLTFWFSSYKRHLQDIEMIDKSIDYLSDKFELHYLKIEIR
jgi:hypothetical protein